MTITELANELNMLIEAGYGDAKAVVGIPTVFITEDGDIWKNDYRDENKYLMSDKPIKDRLTKLILVVLDEAINRIENLCIR